MDDQAKLEKLIIRLENYNAKNKKNKKKKTEEKNKVLESTAELFRLREDIIDFFKKGIFCLKVMHLKQKKNQKKIEKSLNDGIIFIKEKSRDINNDLFNTYFDFSAPFDLAKKIFETKDKKKNSELVEQIKTRWSNLTDEIKKMSKEEIKNEKPDDILGIINKILDFNKEIQKLQGSGLKILTPNQMLSTLTISLAQLKGGNNSEKLKNEIRQTLYSLYRSKKLTKQLYKSLIDII